MSPRRSRGHGEQHLAPGNRPVALTIMEKAEILRALKLREDYVKSQPSDVSHGAGLKIAELALIDEIREKLI